MSGGRGREGNEILRKKCEVKGRNLEDVWGENKRGVTFGEFEDYGEVRG